MLILGISGSLRRDSHNTRLLRAAARALPSGVELEVWDGLATIPPYNEDEDRDPAPPAVRELRRVIKEADALLISTPEYNHSLPGQLKNALDWASRPFTDSALLNKPAAVIGASTSMFGAVWAQAEVRKVLGAAGARVLDRELAVARAESAFREDGRLADDELHVQLAELLAELAADAMVRLELAA
jgi:chromate reductase